MHPVHDFDALLLLATALSSKRRPAELVDVMAAADLVQGNIPNEAKLVEAFERLSRHGLILAQDGGYALTPDAQEIIAAQPKKADSDERLYGIKESLSAYLVKGEFPPVLLVEEDITVAIRAHRAAQKATARNLLVPKPKPADAEKKRPGLRQRKPMPARRRKP